ncbi:MAG: type III pantothenate kinase [Eggerthellaceae bacterium]|nr:type III pantothenate kinase [Eggerthellaceae bacterium]
MAETLLVVDVGNTVTQMGLAREGRLTARWEVATRTAATPDECCLAVEGFLDAAARGLAEAPAPLPPDAAGAGDGAPGDGGEPAGRPGDAALACVVPALTSAWEAALRRVTGRRPLVVGPGVKTGLRMGYKDPAEVGADRIADLVATREDHGAPALVVDLGTATTFEVIDADGSFAGGLIVPGAAMGARALADAAARLPQVELRAPGAVIGRSTEEAMRSGIVWGEAARIDGLADLIEAELGYALPLILSGEGAGLLAGLLRHEAAADPALTLRGLVRLHALNRRPR